MQRQVFASYPDKVIVVRMAASEAGQLNFSYRFDSAHTNHVVTSAGNDLVMQGKVSVVTFLNDLESVTKFGARVRLVAEGGTVEVTNGEVEVKGATAATLLLSAASSYVNYHDVSGDPARKCEEIIEAAAGKRYEVLREEHLKDYQNLFGRVKLDLGPSPHPGPLPRWGRTRNCRRMSGWRSRAGRMIRGWRRFIFRWGGI